MAARAPGGLARAAGGRLSQEGCVGAGCRAAERPGRAVGGRASGSARPARRGPRGPPVSGASGLCWPCCVAVLLQEPRPAGLSACSRVRRARHRGRAGTCGAHRTSQLDPVNCWGFSWAQGPEGQPPPPSPLPGHLPRADSGPSWCPPGHLLSALAPCGNQSSCLRPQRVWPRPLAPHSRRAAPLRAGVCLGNSQMLATGLPEPAELVGREPAGRCRACLCLGGEVPQL